MPFLQLFAAYTLIAIIIFPGSALSLDGNIHVARVDERSPESSSCKLKAPQPSGTSCKVTGTLKQGHYYVASQPTYATSYARCLELCYRRRTPGQLHQINDLRSVSCTAFSFSPKENKCQFYIQPLSYMKFEPGPDHSGTVYSDYRCFDCPNACKNQPLNVNLLDNGGFEFPEYLGPWLGNNYTTIVRKPGFHSGHRIQCGPSVCEINQNFVSCPHNFYRIRFKYQPTPPTPNQLVLTFGAGGLTTTFSAPAGRTVAEAWFQPRYSRLDNFGINFDPQDTAMELDNFEIMRVSEDSFKTLPKAPETVPNGGFESGKLGPWKANLTTGAIFRVRSPGINSTYALHWSSISGQSSQLAQNFTVKPNLPYLLSFTIIKGAATKNFPAVTYNNYLMYEPHTQMNGNTQNYALPFRPVDDVVRLKFDFSGRGTAILDNISFKELDEG